MNRVGSIDLVDLVGICELQGREGLPYPFWRTQAESSVQDASSLADRFTDGDLRVFREWAQAYVHADIWVECRVNYSSEDPDMRILAYRAGQSGFFASQRPGEDVVDVFTLSPYELGAAIAGSVGLTTPGADTQIVIPGYLEKFMGRVDDADDGDYEVEVSRPVSRPRRLGSVVQGADVTVMATVQSRCQPAREWGVNWGQKVVVWVQINDDGDYIYSPDFSHAIPVTAQNLSKRIDQLIAKDVAALRQARGLD